MVYTARIDVSSSKHIIAVLVIVSCALLFAVILGQTGPHLSDIQNFSAFNCTNPNQHNDYTPNNCSGIELNTGVWSQLIQIEAQPMNKHWYCGITTFVQSSNKTEGIPETYLVHVHIFAKNNIDDPWIVLDNSSTTIDNSCSDTLQCQPYVLIYYSSIDYAHYGVQAQFLNTDGSPISTLADVVFSMIKDSPSFSAMSVILKMIFLLLNVFTFAFNYLRLKDERKYWANWTDEQKMFLFLLVALVLYNNPFFALGFIINSWFFPFLGSFLELVFTCALFIFWFSMAEKMRSDDNQVHLTIFLKLFILLVAVYAILATTLYGLVSAWDNQPLLQPNPTLDAMYYTASAFYIGIVLIFFCSLTVSLQTINEKKSLRLQFIFFSIPTVVIIVSVLVGIFLGTLGPFGRDGPSFVYFMTLYNTYIYLLVWGYWPVELSFGGTNPTEGGSLLFSEAKEPKTV